MGISMWDPTWDISMENPPEGFPHGGCRFQRIETDLWLLEIIFDFSLIYSVY